MRKFTKFTLTLALLFGVLGGVKSEKLYWSPEAPWSGYANSTWDGEANKFGWNGTHDVVRAIRTGFTGNLSAYTTLHVNISNIIGGADHLYLKVNSPAGTEQLIALNNGENRLELATYFASIDPTNVNTFELWAPKTSTAECSAVVTDFYLYYPEDLVFDATGKAETNLANLYTTGGLSFAESVLTTDGKAGSLVLEFVTPVSLEYLKNLSITKEGDDNIIDRLTFYNVDGSDNQSWSWYKWGGDNNASAIEKFQGKPIKKVAWVSDAGKANTLSVTISKIVWTMNLLSVRTPNETLVQKSMYKRWTDGTDESTETGESINPDLNLNKSIDGTIFGFGTPEATAYMKLAGYQGIALEGPVGGRLRMFFNATGSAAEQRITINKTFDNNGRINLVFAEDNNLKDLSYIHLNSIKSQYGSTVQVDRIAFYKNVADADGEYDYIIEDNGIANARVMAALNDEDATAIKATGVTAASSLPTANPNCLIVANADKVTNANNVIVDGTCANLELTDGKPFKAPAAFTATAAKFTKTVSDAGYATMVIPFDADRPTGVEAFNLTAVNGETITSSSVNAIAANKPVMIKADAATYEFTATGASIAATADGVVANGLLNGTYATTTAAAGAANYVLQKNGDDVNFYLVKGTPATVMPFRAYLTAPTNARALSFDFNTTGVNGVKVNSENAEVYNLNGQRVAAPQKGLYIVNGKKVIVK